MSATQEELISVARVINEFGYLVVTSHAEHWPGKILTGVEYMEGIPWMVVSETDLVDYLNQCAFAGASGSDVRSFFYRVTTD